MFLNIQQSTNEKDSLSSDEKTDKQELNKLDATLESVILSKPEKHHEVAEEKFNSTSDSYSDMIL